MKAILTEKPSVAYKIATIIGAGKKRDGYIEGNGYLVTWAFGHLIGLALPEAYGYESFQKENLPMLPTEFILTPRQVKTGKNYEFDKGAVKQLKVIESVFDSCDSIIVATDAGREGELIFRLIYNYLNCQKPFSRLWISSLTDKAIRNGFKNLKQGNDFDKLYLAAKVRSQSDWLVGLNATQALTVSAGGGLYSLGRVQTPTLAMVCKRYLEYKHFSSQTYWTVEATHEKEEQIFKTLVEARFDTKSAAAEICEALKTGQCRVTQVASRQCKEKPPLLYDLTTLQKEANNKHGFSADKTLSIAQKLYENRLLTYPRTGSRYISKDILEEIPSLLGGLYTHPVWGEAAKELSSLTSYCVNNQKITDHHAILITENTPNGLEEETQKIYDMVAARMLESFSLYCEKEITQVSLSCNGIELKTKGTVTTFQGWRAVQNKQEEKEVALPILIENENSPLLSASVLEKQTKPKALLSEATLLSAMESAGKELEDENYRKSINSVGIGTPATRASIIETLFSRGYIERQKKTLVPTKKGLRVYDLVKEMKIANAEMTGMWEYDLNRIEEGTLDKDSFLSSIKHYATDITEELLNCKIETVPLKNSVCPKCQRETVVLYPKVAKCSREECSFIIFRQVCGKLLSDAQLEQLLSQGITSEIKGFKGKTGKTFNACLVLDKEFKTNLKFHSKMNHQDKYRK